MTAMHRRGSLCDVTSRGTDLGSTPNARAVPSEVRLDSLTQCKRSRHKVRVIFHVHTIEMLFHVAIVWYPKVAQGTVVCELESDSWHMQPSLPVFKALQEDPALNKRRISSELIAKKFSLATGGCRSTAGALSPPRRLHAPVSM